jgi:large subunit ribosomal protein L7/L12
MWIMAKNLEALSEELSSLTILEAADLVKVLEERWGVSAAAQAVAVAGPAAGAAEEKEEKTEFDVVLVSAGANKLNVIKEIRAITGLALKEAKDAADGANVTLKAGVAKAEAQTMKDKLVAAGATVNLV